MSREHKYRGWNKNKKRFIYINILDNDIPSSMIMIDEPLQEFTGLKDKNGIDIYEGDIWKKEYKNAPVKSFRAEVIFDQGSFLSVPFEKRYYTRPVVQDHRVIEVVGNIYEGDSNE